MTLDMWTNCSFQVVKSVQQLSIVSIGYSDRMDTQYWTYDGLPLLMQ